MDANNPLWQKSPVAPYESFVLLATPGRPSKHLGFKGQVFRPRVDGLWDSETSPVLKSKGSVVDWQDERLRELNGDQEEDES